MIKIVLFAPCAATRAEAGLAPTAPHVSNLIYQFVVVLCVYCALAAQRRTTDRSRFTALSHSSAATAHQQHPLSHLNLLWRKKSLFRSSRNGFELKFSFKCVFLVVCCLVDSHSFSVQEKQLFVFVSAACLVQCFQDAQQATLHARLVAGGVYHHDAAT